MIGTTKVVCLSGSTRFTNEMLMATWEFAKKGIIALGWCVLPTNHNSDGSEIDHHLAEKEGIADLLDELHLRKIDMSDELYVINVGGYIGDGTKREIRYAVSRAKPVYWLEPDKIPPKFDPKDVCFGCQRDCETECPFPQRTVPKAKAAR